MEAQVEGSNVHLHSSNTLKRLRNAFGACNTLKRLRNAFGACIAPPWVSGGCRHHTPRSCSLTEKTILKPNQLQLAIDIYICIDDPGARTQTVSHLFAVRSIENHTTHKCKSQYLLWGPLSITQRIYENLNICCDVHWKWYTSDMKISIFAVRFFEHHTTHKCKSQYLLWGPLSITRTTPAEQPPLNILSRSIL